MRVLFEKYCCTNRNITLVLCFLKVQEEKVVTRDRIAPGLSPNPFMPRSVPGLLTLKEPLAFEACKKKKKGEQH